MQLTVFTPTYNRGYIIKALYESLKRQINYDFEWLVVDDGSTDETEKLFRDWTTEPNRFPIRYYRKENGGKHRAINYALERARGRLFLVVDSDDYLTNDAVEKILGWEKALSPGEKYCGVAGNLGTTETETPNTPFEAGVYEGTLLDRYTCVDGERAIVFYTEVHKRYRYPEFSGERFMTEAVTYNRMANDGFKMRFYNDIICVYEYQEDGLTKTGNRLFIQNPRGYGLWLREKASFLNETFYERIKMYYTFCCDLSSQYDAKTVAECIGIPVTWVRLLLVLHGGINFVRR